MARRSVKSYDAPMQGGAWVAITAILVGLIFIIAGAIVTGIAYTEITPPNYDENYNRYIGSSFPRLIGPFLLVFGAFMVLGSAGVLGFNSMKKYQELEREAYTRGSTTHHSE